MEEEQEEERRGEKVGFEVLFVFENVSDYRLHHYLL